MSSSSDYSQRLKQLMHDAGYRTYRQLSKKSGISLKKLRKLRKGKGRELRVGDLIQLSQLLQISGFQLCETFGISVDPHFSVSVKGGSAFWGDHAGATAPSPPKTDWQAEYLRLKTEQDQYVQDATERLKTEALEILEPWMQYWPVAASAARESPDFPATKLLPLCRPMDGLLSAWQVTSMATVGSEVPYDPQMHQLMEGEAKVGETVRVRYPGYLYQGRLWFRAKVSRTLAQG